MRIRCYVRRYSEMDEYIKKEWFKNFVLYESYTYNTKYLMVVIYKNVHQRKLPGRYIVRYTSTDLLKLCLVLATIVRDRWFVRDTENSKSVEYSKLLTLSLTTIPVNVFRDVDRTSLTGKVRPLTDKEMVVMSPPPV